MTDSTPDALTNGAEGFTVSNANSSLTRFGGDGHQGSHSLARRRRPIPQREQERREEWGKRWGALVRDAVAEAIRKAG